MRGSIKSSKNGKNKKKESSKNIVTSDYILLGVLILLIFVVIGLGTGVYYKKQKIDSQITASIVMPMLKENDEKSFSLDVNELIKNGEYIFKVSNFRGNIVSNKDINYTVTVNKEDNVKVKLIKNDSKDNLFDNNVNTTVTDKILMKKKVKEFDYYTISILEYSDIKEDEKVGIIINS